MAKGKDKASTGATWRIKLTRAIASGLTNRSQLLDVLREANHYLRLLRTLNG